MCGVGLQRIRSCARIVASRKKARGYSASSTTATKRIVHLTGHRGKQGGVTLTHALYLCLCVLCLNQFNFVTSYRSCAQQRLIYGANEQVEMEKQGSSSITADHHCFGLQAVWTQNQALGTLHACRVAKTLRLQVRKERQSKKAVCWWARMGGSDDMALSENEKKVCGKQLLKRRTELLSYIGRNKRRLKSITTINSMFAFLNKVDKQDASIIKGPETKMPYHPLAKWCAFLPSQWIFLPFSQEWIFRSEAEVLPYAFRTLLILFFVLFCFVYKVRSHRSEFLWVSVLMKDRRHSKCLLMTRRRASTHLSCVM